jgi:ATP-dependent exoDNAse (exonuclease V) beta subunit
LLAQGLRKAALAFESLELETLAEQSIVQDLISLTAVFLQPMDTLSYLAILRAPWCGANLHDLTIVRANRKPLSEVLADIAALDDLSSTGKQSLKRLAAIVQPLKPANAALTLSERVYRAWLGLRAPACYEKHELIHAERFFSLLESLQASGEILNRERLLAACTLHKTSSAAGNIKLMTFHKAKGLEFDHVILTGLASKSGGDNRHQALLHHIEQDNKFLIAPNPEAGEAAPTKAGFIKQQLKSIEDEETARLLYVALTRARKQLYLFGTLKPGRDGKIGQPQLGSLLRLLWPACQQDFENSEFRVDVSKQQASGENVETERPSVPLLSLPAALEPLALPDSIHFSPETIDQQTEQPEFDWAQEDTRIIGLAVHQILQFTDAERLKSWQQGIDSATIQASLINSGLISERVEAATERVANILQKMSNDDRAHWLFNADHTQINREWALSCQQNDKIANYIIDRSFVDQKGIRWIVDFKTGTHEGSDVAYFLDEEEKRYAPQLNQYAELVRALEPQREIRLGLYFAALSEWRELKL